MGGVWEEGSVEVALGVMKEQKFVYFVWPLKSIVVRKRNRESLVECYQVFRTNVMRHSRGDFCGLHRSRRQPIRCSPMLFCSHTIASRLIPTIFNSE
jgi:hypothetical protein